MNTEIDPDLRVYLDEYTRGDIIARYVGRTAGAGAEFVLTNVYGRLYSAAIRSLASDEPRTRGLRVLEYGCGGGMNLLRIAASIATEGQYLDIAYGTDFSPPMIDAARQEAKAHLPECVASKVRYVVANNETLASDLERNAGDIVLRETFDLAVGVNTFRYSHRLHKETETARDLYELLRPGGISIMIDMNRNFPFFRSKVKNALGPKTIETYVPSLADYARPFTAVGFDVQTARHFCWIPHSAGKGMLVICRTLSPVLDVCFRRFAMRSLVIARKPR